MLDTSGLNKEEKALFSDVFTTIEKCFNVEVKSDIDLPFGRLELFKDYSHIGFQEAININEGRSNAFVAIIQVEYTLQAGRNSGKFLEFQTWASAYLPKNFGHIFIKPETFKDKLIELFQPIEINFPEDKEFCSKCYVVAKDKQKATQLLNADFRNEVKRVLLDDFYIEIFNDLLIIGNKKSLGNNEVIGLASFVYNISELNY